MKITTWAGFAAVMFVAWGMIGCQDKWQEPERHGCGDGIAIIQMALDTLYCWQGDMACVDGSVLVTDCYGAPAPGFRVSLHLSHAFGRLETTNSFLGDTTNQDGRVEFRYLLYTAPMAGSQVITAEVGGVTTQNEIVFGPTTGMIYRAEMIVDPDTIHLTEIPFMDYSQVSVRVRDSLNFPPACSHFSMPIWVNQGVLDPYPPLDSTGSTTTVWNAPPYPGRYYIHALHDSALVVVDTLHQ